MNEGVKILLARMKTNPEEFIDGLGIRMSKWGLLIVQFKEYLDKADIEAIEEAYKPVMQQHFTEMVMKELLAPEEDNSLGKPWYSNVAHATLSATLTPSPSTVPNNGSFTLGSNPPAIPNISIQRKAQINAMKVQVRKKATLKKEHETLYGKLKNYLHSDT
jgi:hypothetical protein